MKWSISFSYDTRNDDNKVIRVNSTLQTEAATLPLAYVEADKLSQIMLNVKLGAIMPGWHNFAHLETQRIR